MHETQSGRILILIFSVVILIIPDILISRDSGLVSILIFLISKVSILLFIGLLVLSRLKSYYYTYLIVGLPYLVSSFFEIPNILILDQYITVDNVKAVFYTNGNEISDFASKFSAYFMMPVVILLLYFAILLKLRSFRYNLKRERVLAVSVLFLIVSVTIPVIRYFNSPMRFKDHNRTLYILKKYYLKQHPFNLYYRSYEYYLIRHKFNEAKIQKKSFVFGVQDNDEGAAKKPELVVFLIGEKSRYLNWSVNGYNRETSPNLRSNKHLITFSRHYSNANSTSNSIPLIITQATPENPGIAFSQKTIVSLFKEAGYKTAWISAQNIFDYLENEDEVDTLVQLYKRRSYSDLNILPVFDAVLKDDHHDKLFVVINLLGGHHHKLPDRFNVFEPNNKNNDYEVSYKNRKVFINDYDNMILLEDSVISKVITLTKAQDLSSVVLFTSDHGCNLFENSNLFGYGSSNPTEKELHIPLFIWASEKYRNNSAGKWNILKSRKGVLTTNDNLFYTLADLAHIKYKLYKSSLSIADTSYIPSDQIPLYINGGLKYFDVTK
jgi:glucan phosphoethanolaminetransferase (alkaline phosphatase superfamily)